MSTLALIAHDGRKPAMLQFAHDHRSELEQFNLVATSTTGTLLAEAGFDVTCVLSGPRGGDAQIAAMVAEGKCHAVVFFRDPLGKHPHDPDISMLMRLCDVHDVPLATNPSTARLIVRTDALT
ncbi:MAG: methylglyoxal synthase [Bradymonadia bacterium]|jgi:methylglyoxal synthase